MAIKAPDSWCVPLCVECHAKFDSGKELSKQERREMMDEWIIQTIDKLAREGLVRP